MRYIISSAFASLMMSQMALAEVPRVMTDIPPVHSLVAQVMGELGAPDMLLSKGASEHDFQLRPSQAAALAESDLVVWIGPELTPWLDRAMTGLGEGAAELRLLTVPGTTLHAYSEDGAHADHDPAHAGEATDAHAGHDDEGHDPDGADHEGHDHEGTDPHAWLDPANAKLWLGVIAAELARLDPENAAIYQANAATAIIAIDGLDAALAARLAPVKDRPIVVFHDAYGYLAEHYGLTVFGSIALGDATAPGAARLAALRQGTESGAVLCVFPEAQHDAALAEQIGEGSNATLGAPLDPVGSSLEPGQGLYAALLTDLAEKISACTGN